MKAKQFFVTTLAVILTGMFTAANCKGPSAKSDYETVDGDPLKTRIYTLDNGLKVYMSVNKEAPHPDLYRRSRRRKERPSRDHRPGALL